MVTQENTLDIKEMGEDEITEASSLISISMNPDEGEWARKSMKAHFKGGALDGREYFLWKKSEQVRGIVGLHHYDWGPKENVWLSWFAVHPKLQGQGYGKSLMASIEERAKEKGFEKLFIETYDSEDFALARNFYKKASFEQTGHIKNYLPNNVSMIVYSKPLI